MHKQLTTSNILDAFYRVLAPFDRGCIWAGAKWWKSSAADTS